MLPSALQQGDEAARIVFLQACVDGINRFRIEAMLPNVAGAAGGHARAGNPSKVTKEELLKTELQPQGYSVVHTIVRPFYLTYQRVVMCQTMPRIRSARFRTA